MYTFYFVGSAGWGRIGINTNSHFDYKVFHNLNASESVWMVPGTVSIDD